MIDVLHVALPPVLVPDVDGEVGIARMPLLGQHRAGISRCCVECPELEYAAQQFLVGFFDGRRKHLHSDCRERFGIGSPTCCCRAIPFEVGVFDSELIPS
jgi:hypothetical protein